MLSPQHTTKILGYLGLIPFMICLLLSLLNLSFYNIEPHTVFIYYSVAILSFLSGSLWHCGQQSNHTMVIILSNIICLFAFACLLLPVNNSLLVLPFGYFILLLTEQTIAKKLAWYTSSYLSMRIILTLIVSGFHIIAYYLWFV